METTIKNNKWLNNQEFSYDLRAIVTACNSKDIDVTKSWTIKSDEFTALLTQYGGVEWKYFHKTVKRLFPRLKYRMIDNEHYMEWNPNETGYTFKVKYLND